LAKTTIKHTARSGIYPRHGGATASRPGDAIDARLLVLDEPTLGLDILFRKQFYDSLLNDYFDRTRTILVTTHQVEELQHILTIDVHRPRRIVLSCSMEEFESR